MVALVETMAYAGQVPWHGLGVEVSNDLSVDEMLCAAGLDWKVRKAPTFFNAFDQEAGQARVFGTGRFALIRETDNKILTHVSDTWEPCQNDEAFAIFEEFVERNDLEMHTAGSLKGGELVWGLAKMKQSFVMFDEDLTEQYLLLVNPHQFGRAIHIRNTPVRVVCNNTLSLALSSEVVSSANQSHRSVFDPEAMKEAIGIATIQLDKYAEAARFIGSRQYQTESLENYFDELFPNMSVKREKEHSRQYEVAMEALDRQPGARYGKGTWWQAFNTVTFMADHLHGNDTDKRMQSAWFGVNANRKVHALNRAVEYAEAA